MKKGTFKKELVADSTLKVLEYAIAGNFPVLLKGETGTGKTSLVRYLAEEHKADVARVNLNGSTDIEDFLGQKVVTEKNGASVIEWRDGVLLDAMRTGKWIIIDEINASPPEINFVLHSLLDDDRSIFLKEWDNETVTPHKDFRLFATMNPRDYAGTRDLNQALLSRFNFVVQCEYPSTENELAIVEAHTGYTGEQMPTIIDLMSRLREAHRNGEVEFIASPRESINIARLLQAGWDLDSALRSTIVAKCEKEEREAVEKLLELVAGYNVENKAEFVSVFELAGKLEEREKKIKAKQDLLNKKCELLNKVQELITKKDAEGAQETYQEFKEVEL